MQSVKIISRVFVVVFCTTPLLASGMFHRFLLIANAPTLPVAHVQERHNAFAAYLTSLHFSEPILLLFLGAALISAASLLPKKLRLKSE